MTIQCTGTGIECELMNPSQEPITDRDRKLILAGENLACVTYRSLRRATGIIQSGIVYGIDKDRATAYAAKVAAEDGADPWVGEPYFKEADGWWAVSFKGTKPSLC